MTEHGWTGETDVNDGDSRTRHAQSDVYIGRRNNRLKLPESIWHNPFVLGKAGTREEVIAKFEAYILAKPELLAQLHVLKGKRLACFCAPQPCHGHILAKLADAS